MKRPAQMEAIDRLIAEDESSIAILESKIAELTIYASRTEGSPYRARLGAWLAFLVVLKQGLEGLRLKHDALVEGDALHGCTTRLTSLESSVDFTYPHDPSAKKGYLM